MQKWVDKLPFRHARWFEILVLLIKRFEQDRCRDVAGSLTYTTMLSIVPMLTVFIVIVSSIPALADARNQIQAKIYDYLLPSSSAQVSAYLTDFAQKSSTLSVVGVIFLFVTAILMFSTMERVFNEIWKVRHNRGGVSAYLRYWALVSLGPILLGGAFALSSAVTSIQFLNQNFNGYSINWGIWLKLASFFLLIGGFTFLYKIIPNCKVPLKNAFLGGLIATILFVLFKNFFGLIMTKFTSYEAVYGAFAALPIFLLWIYSSWCLILLGVEISYVLTIYQTAERHPRHPVLALLDILQLLYKHQKVGTEVLDTEAMGVLGRGEVEKWYEFADVLHTQDLITKTEKGNYVLSRNLSEVDFWEFYKQLPYPLPRREDLGKVNADDTWIQVIGPYLLQTEAYQASKLALPLDRVLDVGDESDKSPRRKRG